MTTSKLTAFAATAALTLATAATATDVASDPAAADLGNDQGTTQKIDPNLGACSMDYDNSGTVDFGDFLHVMSNWGANPNPPQFGTEPPTGDSGGYGFAELLEVINNYGRRCKRTIG
ncbi:MAG: hypothetical protein ACYTGP_00255 [Planctomycetota bacterium]|jgi:hypothetical protein